MVEEAIRNGTWIPPTANGSSGRGKVDLSKKPVLFEAYVPGLDNEHDGGEKLHKTEDQIDWDWDSIRPFSAAYIPPPSGTPRPLRMPQSGSAGAASPAFPPRLSLMNSFLRFIRPNLQSSAPYPLNERRLSEVNLDASKPVDWSGYQKKLRVAVLVAMPRPPTDIESSKKAKSTITSSSLSLDQASSLSSSIPLPLPLPRSLHEQEILPLVEFGVAELDVKQFEDADRVEAQLRHKKSESRASGSGSLYV